MKSYRRTLLSLLAATFLAAGSLLAQQKTTVADTLLDGQGNPLAGYINIQVINGFTSSDNFTVAAGTNVRVTVAANGTFSVALVPNQSSTPSGSSYAVYYYLSNTAGPTRIYETWVVPISATAVNIAAVRVATAPINGVAIPFAQLLPPSGCSANQNTQWTGTAWTCAASSGSGTVTSFSAGNMSPVFTTSVATPTSTPALSFSLSNAGAHAFLGNNTGASAVPAYVRPAFTDISGTALVTQGGTGLTSLTAHDLYAGNGISSPNPIAAGSAGQVLISNGGSADPTFQDPIVSSAYVNLLNSASATSTQTSASVRVPTFSGFGTLYVTYAGIAGSPSGCTLQLKNADSLGNLINNGSALSTSPANGTTTTGINSAAGLQTEAQLAATYACSTYPTAGTLSVDYVPGQAVGIEGTPTVTANAGTGPTTAWKVDLSTTGANATAIKVDGSGVTQPISGTVTSNIGTTNGLALDATVAKLNNAQGSTTSGQTGPLAQGAVTTSAPTYTTAQTSPLSLTTAGALRVDSSAVTQPVSGTVTANQGSPPWQIVGNVASGASDSGNPAKVGGIFNTTQPTVLTGQRVDLQATARGELLVAKGVSGFSIDNTGFNVNNTPTVVQGNAGSNAQAWWARIGDATNGPVAVKAASTAAAAADPSLVVALSPNSPIPTGSNVIGALSANQSINVAQVAGSSTTTLAAGEQKVGVEGLAASGAAKSGNPVQAGYVFNTTQPTVTTGQAVEAQGTARGAAIVATGTDTFNVTVNAALPTGSNVIGALSANQSVNIAQVAGAATSTAASGTQKVGIVGNAGAAMDAAGQNVASPANSLLVGAQFNTTPTTLLTGNMSPLQMDSAGNLLVNVKAGGGSGGTSSSFGAASPGTGTAAGLKSTASAPTYVEGDMEPFSSDLGGLLRVRCDTGCAAAGDTTTGSTALGALNATITVALAGERGAAFQLQSGGTGVYTVTPQCSFDGGTIYNANGYIQDPFSGALSTTATIASAQATTDYPVMCPQGASHAQMKVTAYTSGTANWLARSTVITWPSINWGVVTTSAPSYTTGQISPFSLTTSGAVRVDGSGVTQPVSGTITANQGGTWTVQPGNTANTTAWLVTGTGGTFPATQSGTWTVQPGNTQNTTAWLTQDAANGTVAAGAAAGKSELAGCQFNTTLPTLTTGQQAATQCDSSARLLVGSIAGALPTGSNTIGAVTQASGPWTSNLTQVGSSSVTTLAAGEQKVGVEGLAASGAAKAGNPNQIGYVFNTTQPTVTTGQAVEAQGTARGAAIVATGVDTFNVTVNAALPTGANTIGAVTQASGPWTSNITQFGGTNLSTGTGASGVGIPRVTVANDSNILATQSGAWTVTSTQGTAAVSTAGWPVTGGNLAETTAAWTSATTVNTALTLTVTGYNAVAVFLNQGSTITGGVVTFEGSDTAAFTNAYAVNCSQANSFTSGSTYTLVASTNQAFICNTAAYTAFRVRLSTVITGTATVNVGIQADSQATKPEVTVGQATAANLNATVSGTVTANQGTPTNWATNVAQFGGTNVSTGTGVGGAGIPRVTISNDSSLAANQSVNVAQIGGTATVTAAAGVQKVGIVGNANAAFDAAQNTAAPANVLTIAGRFDTTLPTVASGSTAALETDSSGRLLVGSIASALPTGSNVIGALSANQSVNVAQIAGSTTSTAAAGTQKVGIVGNAGAAFDAATGAAPPANAVYVAGKDQAGNTQAFFIDPCQDASLTRSSTNINQTAGAQLITGTAAKQTYICSLNLISATAQNVALVEGTGTTCGTGTAGMAGGTTAATGWNLSANGGLVSNGTGFWVFRTATAADNVCLIMSGTGQISGNLTWVQK